MQPSRLRYCYRQSWGRCKPYQSQGHSRPCGAGRYMAWNAAQWEGTWFWVYNELTRSCFWCVTLRTKWPFRSSNYWPFSPEADKTKTHATFVCCSTHPLSRGSIVRPSYPLHFHTHPFQMHSTLKAQILKCSLKFLPSTLNTTRVCYFFCQMSDYPTMHNLSTRFEPLRPTVQIHSYSCWNRTVEIYCCNWDQSRFCLQNRWTDQRYPSISSIFLSSIANFFLLCHHQSLWSRPLRQHGVCFISLRTFLLKLRNNYIDTVGSCSMVPRHKNGVVDPQLRVYGTTNVRVADISIMPLHVAAHTQSE